jgi:hypothetical protein
MGALDSFNSGKGSFQVNYRGEPDNSIRPQLAIAQLVEPDPKDPVCITGLRLPVVNHFRTPCDMSLIAEPFDASNIQANLTPEFSFVDLHIGRFRDTHWKRVTNWA